MLAACASTGVSLADLIQIYATAGAAIGGVAGYVVLPNDGTPKDMLTTFGLGLAFGSVLGSVGAFAVAAGRALL